uniref:WAP domain-containing protein n=1 Tax=Oreochromis aureus TaxID=47969 RepID=A0A668RQ66_OREAU
MIWYQRDCNSAGTRTQHPLTGMLSLWLWTTSGPYLLTEFVLLSVKPGVCPLRLPAAFGPCVESCSTDSDCHDNEKCCFKGCGHECMAPVTVKPGVCPLRHPPAFGPCVESCSKDSDCHNNEKCCYNGCGHVCMAPYIDFI